MADGADGIEFDVRLTKDHVPVIIHDDTLERTSCRRVKVADHTWDELKTSDVGSWFRARADADYSGETLPSLQQVFDLFSVTPGILYLEMKSESAQREALATACCQMINESALKDRIIVECFDLPAIEHVKRIDASIKTAALFEPSISTPPLFAARRIVDAAKAVSADEIALHHRLASPKVIEKARSAGFNVVVWTVDDPSWIQRGIELGVTALITNNPSLMLAQ
jgi:glycerophosphoryl diester phosphodiesterase